ncbi:hypothetical protein L249_1263 [Ophiocordyceps polyrhachis-furcata BCC 54312]|uniref:Uncharacterized protein n=1 Tax=Ophiocordyceps polyrhachis-furcata BCC 54312 TaxID=1330021 RepID=A0A367LCC0_9HYPO|nr:hypothetical protein L249_1263 [Ophiocordyceps polyrhachis-furcata BCC 54312]
MAKIKDGRRGAPTPSLKLSGGGGGGICGGAEPTSPPETPTVHRPAHPPPAPFYRFSHPLSQDPNIKPMGNGHQFSYRPAAGPTQLSPRSSSEPSDSDPASSPAEVEAYSSPPPSADAAAAAAISTDEHAEPEEDEADSDSDSDCEPVQTMRLVQCELIIEDLDPMDSDYDNPEAILPTEIESIRSFCPKDHKDLDRGMMQDLKNLNCSTEASNPDPSAPYDEDEEAFLQRRQELRRHRRVSLSSSFGKRTHSELSDSDNDETGALDDVNDVGSSARRLRKRLHRSSLHFQDPPEPRIDEQDEPDSDGDAAGTSLARELPYFDELETMEMDSS